jgi:phosphate starvation-inducible PhoH-like protein
MKKRAELRSDQIRHLSQISDSQIQILKETYGIRVNNKRGKMTLQGDDQPLELAQKSLQTVLEGMDKGKSYNDEDFKRVCLHFQMGSSEISDQNRGYTPSSTKDAPPMVQHMTKGQGQYIKQMQDNVVTFVTGPAGTGKTFLAVGMAVQYLLMGKVEKIILVRPAVEAGEKLGYLPGDLNEKIRPYLLPLFDALRYFLGQARAEHYSERNVIEIAPLAYMRGRTLDNSFMILDEAQNTTPQQMKMFLTRIGKESRAVITGDVSQIDLDHGTMSGMVHATKILKNVKGVAQAKLEAEDIVRHPVVAAIVKAYDNQNENS